MHSGKSEFNEAGNRAIAETRGIRIKTVEQLVDYLHIDLDVWEIERAIVNKWEVGAKDDFGSIIVEPLYQVKLFLIKRKPVPLVPVVSPVIVKSQKKGLPRYSGKRRYRALLLFDTHFGFSRSLDTHELTPFHDRGVLSIALQIAQQINPEISAFGGDVIDLADTSDKFMRSPEMYWTTQPAIIEGAWYIGQIAKHSKKTYVLPGNHDARLEKALLNHFLWAYDLKPADKLDEPMPMTINGLLGLKSMGVEYIENYPAGRLEISNDFVVLHGDIARKQPGATGTALIERELKSVAFGHIHRRETVTKTIWVGGKPKFVTAFSPGCCCRIDGAVPGSKTNENWQQGFAIIEFDKENPSKVDIIPVIDGVAYYNGKNYFAEDYEKQITEFKKYIQPSTNGKK